VPILSFSDVLVEFGATTLLSDVFFTVAAGERWGIVGWNGAGKTTLLRLIDGTLSPARGTVTRQPGLRIALVDQKRDFGGAETAWDAAASGYGDLLALEHDLARQAERLAELGEGVTEADLARFGRDQERFAHAGGYELEARVDAVLQGLAAWGSPPSWRPRWTWCCSTSPPITSTSRPSTGSSATSANSARR
jgi:ATP-binding cassette subfamily F protein 3